MAIRTIEIGRRRADGQKYQAALGVDRGKAPHVRARPVFPAIAGPRLVAGFAPSWNSVKGPEQFAEGGIPAAHVSISALAWRRLVVVASGNENVLVYDRRRFEIHFRIAQFAQYPGFQIEKPFV